MNDSQTPNDFDAFFSLFSGGENAKIRELVQNLRKLMRDNNDDSTARSYDYLRQWLAENIELDGVDRQYAFYYGFLQGIAFLRELNKAQKKEEGEE